MTRVEELKNKREILTVKIERAANLGYPAFLVERELIKVNRELKHWEYIQNGKR